MITKRKWPHLTFFVSFSISSEMAQRYQLRFKLPQINEFISSSKAKIWLGILLITHCWDHSLSVISHLYLNNPLYPLGYGHESVVNKMKKKRKFSHCVIIHFFSILGIIFLSRMISTPSITVDWFELFSVTLSSSLQECR